MIKKIITAVLCCFLGSIASAQSCPSYTNNLIINTGYNYSTNTVIPVSTATTAIYIDPNWMITNDTDPITNEPMNPYVVFSGSSTYSLSQAINSYTGTSNGTNGLTTFQYKFSVTSVLSLTLSLNIKVDDESDVYLNGMLIGHTASTNSFIAVTCTNSATFLSGENKIEIKMLNVGGILTELIVWGSLQASSNVINSALCTNQGCFVQGKKYFDKNSNSVFDGTDSYIPNWPIYLKNGTNTYTTLTNGNGYYYFAGIPAGTYTLGEQTTYTNITIVSPASGQYTLSLTSGTVITNKDFANNFSCCNFDGTVYINGNPQSVSSSSAISVCKDQKINLSVANNCGYPSSMLNGFTWDMGDGTTYNGTNVSHAYSSNGNFLLKMKNTSATCTNTAFTLTLNISDCYGNTCDKCISSFAPSPGKYIISLWAREDHTTAVTSYTGAGVQISFINDPIVYGPFYADVSKSQIIDGWQRIEAEFNVPPGATDMKIKLVNNSSVDAYYDDVRIHPINGNMKSYVYDPVTLRLSAELDENNYATFYEYNEEGQLIRVKKETEKGTMTIKETRSSNKKQ